MIYRKIVLFLCTAFSLNAMEQNKLDEKEWPSLVSKVVQKKLYNYKLFKKIEELRDSFETALVNARKDSNLAPIYCTSGRDNVFCNWDEASHQGIFLHGRIDKPLQKILTPWGSIALFWILAIGSPNATEEQQKKVHDVLNNSLLQRVEVDYLNTDHLHVFAALTKIDNLVLPEAKLFRHEIPIPQQTRVDAWLELTDKYRQEKERQKQ